MSDARFDIVIPTYERPGLLVETVESAFAQTADGVRVAVADNVSGPATTDALAPYVDRLTHRRFDEHVPYQVNLSRAQSMLAAPFGLVLHDDDLLDPEYAETALDAFARHPTVGMVIVAARPIAAPGTPIPDFASTFAWAEALGHAATGRGPAGAETLLPAGAFPSMVARIPWSSPYWPCIAFRTEAFQAAGAFDPELRTLLDVEMWMRVGAAHPVLLIDATRCSYRFHAGSKTTEMDAAAGDAFVGDIRRIHAKSRRDDAAWNWSDDEAHRWLSFALYHTARGGRAEREAAFAEQDLAACGGDLDRIVRDQLEAHLLWLRMVPGARERVGPLAEIACRARLWLASR